MRLRAMMSGAILVVCLGTLLVAGAATAANQELVTLCHVRPGDPANVQKILVTLGALDAHLRNHPDDISDCCTSDADCPESDACTIRYCEDASNICQEVDLSPQCMAGPCEVAFL